MNDDQIESLIENINTYYFKRGLTIEEFVNIINKIVALSQKLGMPVDQLSNHIAKEELELEKLRRNRRYKNEKTSGLTRLQCNYE